MEKKQNVMKKNGFIQGAFIATIGIVISKILGILYVIPFYAIIGEQGGALYGYAYNLYAIFMGLSSSGIPFAISKLISEYNTLGYQKAKIRAFRMGKKMSLVLGVVCFLLLFIFAPTLSHWIIGDITGGNTKEEIVFVIRIIATAILVVPIMSIYRGYLQGHKVITPTSISQVLEQVVRIVIILVGSFLAVNVFHLSLKTAVGCAVFGATVGALASYFYLFHKHKKNKKVLVSHLPEGKVEPKISDKTIFRKIIVYAVPFIMIDFFKSIYNSVDMVTLVKTLVDGLGYSVLSAESIMSVISTWGLKLNMIILAVSTGIMVSLIPNLTASFVSNNMEDVRRKINQTLQSLFYITLPMTVGISLLSKPIWMIFYGESEYGSTVLAYFIFVALATALFTAVINIVQILKEYKVVAISLISGFLTKVLLTVPLIYGFHKIGLPAYYGAITATILGLLVPTVISLYVLRTKYKVGFEDTVKQGMNMVASIIAMVVVVLLLRFVLPVYVRSRLMNIPLVLLYALFGSSVYFFLTYQFGTLEHVFGDKLLKNIKKKWKGRS